MVVPGGHAVGVLLTSEGIIVVGYDNVAGQYGYSSPARTPAFCRETCC